MQHHSFPAPAFAVHPPGHGTCANLSTPQTPTLGAPPQPLVDTPQAEAVPTALDRSISHAGRAAEGAMKQKGSSIPRFERRAHAHLSVLSLRHRTGEFGGQDRASGEDPV